MYIKKTQNISETLQEGVQTQLASKEYDCNNFGVTVSGVTADLPPLLMRWYFSLVTSC